MQSLLSRLFIVPLLLSISMLSAQTRTVLYPNSPDTAQGYYLYFPANPEAPSKNAIVVCPGGGYQMVAMDHEGLQTAKWINELGIDAYIVRYRISNSQFTYQYPDQLNDLNNTIASVRKQHKKLGVMGFSAGGHLAGMGLTENKNRLALGILVYPVITADSAYWHRGSFRALFGEKDYRVKAGELASVEKRISKHTPPLWIVHCKDDKTVPVANAQLAYEAIKPLQPSSVLQLYEKGGHGFGMRPINTDAKAWKDELKQWLQTMKFL